MNVTGSTGAVWLTQSTRRDFNRHSWMLLKNALLRTNRYVWKFLYAMNRLVHVFSSFYWYVWMVSVFLWKFTDFVLVSIPIWIFCHYPVPLVSIRFSFIIPLGHSLLHVRLFDWSAGRTFGPSPAHSNFDLFVLSLVCASFCNMYS